MNWEQRTLLLSFVIRYIQLFIGKYADLFTRRGATLNSLWGPEGVKRNVVAVG